MTDDIKQLAALKFANFKEWQSLQYGDVKKSEVYDEYRKLNRESTAATNTAKNAIVNTVWGVRETLQHHKGSVHGNEGSSES